VIFFGGQIFTILQKRQIFDKPWKNVVFSRVFFLRKRKSVHFCAKEKILKTVFYFSFVS
jgi:hypothetical protein